MGLDFKINLIFSVFEITKAVPEMVLGIQPAAGHIDCYAAGRIRQSIC